MAKYLTREGMGKFKKELEYLENTKRKEIADSYEKYFDILWNKAKAD